MPQDPTVGYRALLAEPGFRGTAAASVLARLPLSMVAPAGILLLRGSLGSYAIAGVAVALFGGCSAMVSPLLGRLVDRHPPGRVLVPAGVLRLVALVGLVLASRAGSTAGCLVLAAAAGAGEPPVTPVVRSAYSRLDADLRHTALGLDSVLIEAVFLSGPLLVAACVLLSGPAAGVLTAGALGLLGAVLVARRPGLGTAAERAGRSRGGPSVVGLPVVQTVFTVSALQVVAFASVETAFTAAARDRGTPALAGVCGAVWAAASAVGGLTYAARRWPGQPTRRYAALSLGVALGEVPLALTSSPLLLMALLPLAGLAIAPCVSAGSELQSLGVPEERLGEAFAWTAGTSGAAGAAVGFALAGSLIDAIGVRPTFLVAASVAGAAALIPVLRRASLP